MPVARRARGGGEDGAGEDRCPRQGHARQFRRALRDTSYVHPAALFKLDPAEVERIETRKAGRFVPGGGRPEPDEDEGPDGSSEPDGSGHGDSDFADAAD